MNASDTIVRCGSLKRFWQPRNVKFKDWYKLISMVDELKQEKMESFVSNDPLANFRLLRHMLDQHIPHRVPQKQLTADNSDAAATLSLMFDTMWEDINERHRSRGREGWLWDFTGMLLATGWYSVFAMMSQDGKRAIAEIWNPAEVYPSWDDELTEVAHTPTLAPYAAKRMAARNGWNVDLKRLTSNQKVYDYWRMDDGGNVFNTIVMGTELMKAEQLERGLTRIPVFVSPCGGLPDEGIIMENQTMWKGQAGMSAVSTNENVYRYWNKWWTFNMQHLRDIVQSTLLEKSRTGKPIVKPEDIGRRGKIFRMTPEEDVGFLQPPPMPVEMRTVMLDMEAMMQRGGPAWSMFGSIQGQMTAYVMSQIAASTDQVVKPFHRGIMGCLKDIDNFWLGQIRQHGYSPHGIKMLEGTDTELKLSADYEIRIPGDLIQRATVARMLDPDYRLSYSRVTEEVFPEIDNPMQERARIRADEAERNPIHSIITLVRSFEAEAEAHRLAGDRKTAELYEKAAQRAKAMLEPEQQEPPPPGNTPIGGRPEAIPPEGTTEAPMPSV